jgi:TIR domain-containing protein
MTLEDLARLIQRLLKRSGAVEIDGLGVFARNKTGDISFEHSNCARIFIAYATEDRAVAERLYNELTALGFAAWMDRRKLLPGQDWPQRIEDAIASSDFFIACFSGKSVKKRGGFQTEIRHALNCASSVPLDDVFLIPVRLDDCRVPARIQRETQYVDLFPDWVAGFERVLRIIERRNFLAA